MQLLYNEYEPRHLPADRPSRSSNSHRSSNRPDVAVGMLRSRRMHTQSEPRLLDNVHTTLDTKRWEFTYPQPYTGMSLEEIGSMVDHLRSQSVYGGAMLWSRHLDLVRLYLNRLASRKYNSHQGRDTVTQLPYPPSTMLYAHEFRSRVKNPMYQGIRN